MKKKLKRGMSGLLAALLTFTAVFGSGVTALAASPSGATSKSYSVAFPRDGDANQIYSEDVWGHSAKTYMNGWSTSESTTTTVHCMDSFDGQVVYCIEPGVPRSMARPSPVRQRTSGTTTPSSLNRTIEPDDIKVLLGPYHAVWLSGESFHLVALPECGGCRPHCPRLRHADPGVGDHRRRA